MLVVVVATAAFILYSRLQRATAVQQAAYAAEYTRAAKGRRGSNDSGHNTSSFIVAGPVEMDYLKVIGTEENGHEATQLQPGPKTSFTNGTTGKHYYPTVVNPYMDPKPLPDPWEHALSSRPLSIVRTRPDSLLETEEQAAAKMQAAQNERLAKAHDGVGRVDFSQPIRASSVTSRKPHMAETGF